MTQPVRLRLFRAKGFNLQDASLALNGLPAVVVARPTDFGNPFVVGRYGNAKDCIDMFEALILLGPCITNGPPPAEQMERRSKIMAGLPDLRDKNLACWCALDAPCHADVLLKLANAPICEEVT